MTNLETAILYSNKVINDEILSCIYTKQAVTRFLNDLDNPLYYFDHSEIDSRIEFLSNLKLTENFSHLYFNCEPWQVFIICSIYGFYIKKTNERKVKNAYIEIARKNSKTQLISALALFDCLFSDNQQIVCCANSREQIKLTLFKKLKLMCNQLDFNQKHLKQHYNKISFKSSEIIVTASDSKRLDGIDPDKIIYDEIHEAKNNDLYNVLKSAQGTKLNRLILIITTSGFDLNSFAYQMRNYNIEVLSGKINDPEQFSIIYTLDESDLENFDNPINFIKSNPNLNISIQQSFIISELEKAKHNSIDLNGIMVKNLNVWMKSNKIKTWIPDKYYKQSFQKISIYDEKFKGQNCWVGLDLASVSDLTCATFLFQVDNILYFFNKSYICEESKNDNINRELYINAVNKGELIQTLGNVTDYSYILNDILEINKTNPIILLNYDKFNSTQIIVDLTNAGIYCKPFSQLAGSFNKPMKFFEHQIKSGNIIIEENGLVNWMFNNVQLEISKEGNYKLNKEKISNKIDVVSSTMDAIGAYLEMNTSNVNVW